MALNNRIYKYTCDVCDRSIERLADPTRPDPLRCVITDQCPGKLSLTNTRFGLRPVNTPTVIGLLDRIKRGANRQVAELAQPLDKVNLSTFTGSHGLSLAMLKISEPSPGVQAYHVTVDDDELVLETNTIADPTPTTSKLTGVLFELTPQALEYKRYVYSRIERCVYVTGKDDSAAQALLTFDDTSNIRVYVNGRLLEASQYDKTQHGTISFTPELEEPTILIEIFVYKSLTQFFSDDEAVRLDFVALSSTDDLRSGGAWGDVRSVDGYAPLYCADISALDPTRTYGLVRFETVDPNTEETVVIDPIGYLLLANPPYAFEDKRLTANVPVSALVSEGFTISFAINGETGESNVVIDGETLAPLARPLSVTKLDSITSTQGTETVGLLVGRNEKTFILGPA